MVSSVAMVRSSTSVGENLIEVLVMGGGEEVATLDVILTGGGGAKVEARVALGGVVLRSAFFEADGEEEAGGEWVARFFGANFMEVDFLEECFLCWGESP